MSWRRQLWAKVSAPIKFRFSIATLLIILTVVSIWLAKISNDAREQKDAVKHIRINEGFVQFEVDRDVPLWLKNAIGEDYFRSVKGVRFRPHEGTRDSNLSKANDANLKHLASLSNIESLGLGNNCAITDAGLVHLRALTKLTKIDLSRTGVRGPGLVHLADLPRLEVVQLGRTDLQDSGLKHLGQMTSLTRVTLQNTKITDAGMRELAKATALKRLRLTRTSITDTGLMHLEPLKQLERLDVVGTFVTASGVARLQEALPNCRVDATYGLGETPSEELLFPEGYQPTTDEINAKLKQLNLAGDVRTYYSRPDNPSTTLTLSRSKLSDRALLSLVEQIPDLKRIFLFRALVGDEFLRGIRGKKLRDLRLESTRVTDEGMRYIAQMPKLERLQISDTNISDKGFAFLYRLSNIESIHLDGTRVTSRGVDSFQDALPTCKVFGVFP